MVWMDRHPIYRAERAKFRRGAIFGKRQDIVVQKIVVVGFARKYGRQYPPLVVVEVANLHRRPYLWVKNIRRWLEICDGQTFVRKAVFLEKR